MGHRQVYALPPRKAGEAPWVKGAYGLAAGLILLGVVVAGVAGGSALSALTRGTHPVTVPGAATLKLKPGVYAGVRDPRSTGTVAGLFVTVQDDLTRAQVPVITAPGGPTLFQFEILDEGDYTLSAVSSVSVPLLVLHESVNRVRSDLVVGGSAGVLLLGAGIALLVYVHGRRAAEAKPD